MVKPESKKATEGKKHKPECLPAGKYYWPYQLRYGYWIQLDGDFLNWLEEVKSKSDGAGVILIFHEPKKMVSYMLLEALQRHHLLGKFHEIVTVLSRVLLDREEQFDNASNRAKIIWEIAQHLGQELGELKELRKVAERSSSFQPIFSATSKMNYRDIQRINVLRSILAEGKSDYNTIKSTYETDGKQGLIKELDKLQITRKDQQHDLLEILDSHFDPKRTATFPNTKTPKKTNNRKLQKTVSSDDSGAVSLDTTRTTSPLKNAADKTEWNDMNLRWNTSEYGGVRDLRIPPHRLWKPDVLMYN
ncbi:maternal protein exuperantia-2-like, partial [Ctenocephalides felis]|uniref:maternal protein exuperantia-2-like n=1 Tax=Ctenocephalides felis TaxID=7515 RepID=UPI000E6E2B75